MAAAPPLRLRSWLLVLATLLTSLAACTSRQARGPGACAGGAGSGAGERRVRAACRQPASQPGLTHPRSEMLAQALLRQPGGGAIAVLAPTSLTLPTNQSCLSSGLARELHQSPVTTPGESLLRARRSAWIDDPGQRDVLEIFLLFGDPGLQLAAHQR